VDPRGFLARAAFLCLLGLPPARAVAAAPPPPPLPPPAVRAWQTGLLRPDRLQHASLAFTIGLGAGLLSRDPAVAAGSALALGLLKEVRDSRSAGFDRVDLAADALGAGLAAAATCAAAR